jgi:hypothetical protein
MKCKACYREIEIDRNSDMCIQCDHDDLLVDNFQLITVAKNYMNQTERVLLENKIPFDEAQMSALKSLRDIIISNERPWYRSDRKENP